MIINGVVVHPKAAYISYDLWYKDLINRAIPEMGYNYMNLFIECGMNPDLSLLYATHINREYYTTPIEKIDKELTQ